MLTSQERRCALQLKQRSAAEDSKIIKCKEPTQDVKTELPDEEKINHKKRTHSTKAQTKILVAEDGGQVGQFLQDRVLSCSSTTLRRTLPSGGIVSFIATFLVSTVSSMATLAAEKQKTHTGTQHRCQKPG